MVLPAEVRSGVRARWALAITRVYLGVIFLVAVGPKLRSDFTPSLTGFVSGTLPKAHPAFYQRFLEQVVLPHAHLFAVLVMVGELLVGVMLVLGIATRLAAGVALLMTLCYMLAKGQWVWSPGSSDAAFAVIAVALIVGAGGRSFGMDGMFARRWPGSRLW